MSSTAAHLKRIFLHKYHRFPGYLQAKRESLAARARAARWQLETRWQQTIHPFEPLAGKSREEIKRILFREPTRQIESSPPSGAWLVEQYKHFGIFSLEGRYFAISGQPESFSIEALQANQYDPCIVGHAIPDVKHEIDRFWHSRQHVPDSAARKERALFITNVAPEQSHLFFERLAQYDLTILETSGRLGLGGDNPRIPYLNAAGKPADFINLYDTSETLLQDLRRQDFDLVITPYEQHKYWTSINLEVFVAAFAKRLMVMFADGPAKFYSGEDINRIKYNKYILHDIFAFLPPLKGKRILEVGCSDGLACDLLLCEDPEALIGIDCMDAVGCSYRDPRIHYFNMNASDLEFKDGAFDVSYSLATLEHVEDPFAVMQEMKRVTRKGGYCVVQAGPLYHAPFGHHMFGYFDDYPWIHLRLTPEQIVDYARRMGIADQIQQQRGLDAKDYVSGMLAREHVNHLRIEEYRLDEFMRQPDVKVLNFVTTSEGEELLTTTVRNELPGYRESDLVTSGFELIIKVK
jgi:ubiquinone/menaquinone biosynthesis C-methylase UbiE